MYGQLMSVHYIPQARMATRGSRARPQPARGVTDMSDVDGAGSTRDLPGGGPLWSRLRSNLENRLAEGDFDDAFPGELALAREYGLSRHTIREALRGLRSDGLITAARGRASRVAADSAIEQPMGALYSLFTSVESAGIKQRSQVRYLDVRTDADAAANLGIVDDAPLVYLERLRMADDEPLAVDQVWLPAGRTRPLLAADFSHTSLYEQLSTSCGIRLTGGQERIRAVVPTREEQSLLCCPSDVAALALDRLGCAGGEPIEWRHTLIRGDRFSLTAQFTPHTYRFGNTDPATTPLGERT